MSEAAPASKELKEDVKKIENDPISLELDNIIGEDTESPDNEIEGEVKTEAEETGETDEKVPDMQINGDRLESDGVSVDIQEEIAGSGTGDVSGMQVTGEEREAENSSDVFGMTTGAARFSGGDMADTQQQDVEQQNQAGDVFDELPETGAKKPIGKVKRFLFSTIIGLKKAKKGIGNFFKKKLPNAFKTGGQYAKKALMYTPVAPLISLVDKVVEKREKSRPQREEKARQKKEKWLLDQDEKRKQKEEEERVKEKMKELEAKYEAARKEYNKLHNTLSYRTGKFFSGMWGGIKSGASWIGNKIKTGASWVGNKIKNSKVGVIGGIFAAKTLGVVKTVVNNAKEIIGGAIVKVSSAIDQMKDEYDEYSFEDRMQLITEEENKKRRKGLDVPKEDYRTRYLALTAELKGKLASIRNNINRREEIETVLAELENNEVLAVEGKEEISHYDWMDVDSITKKAEIASTVFNLFGEAKSFFDEKTALPKVGVIRLISELGLAGAESGKVDRFRKRKKFMDAIASTSKDELIKRMSRYAKSNAELQEMESGFNVAINLLNAGKGLGEATGMAPLAQGLGAISSIATGVKMLATSSKKRSNVKSGIKDMLGGREGYYSLKAKYKMHAPEMRRAVRDALGVATSEDAVTADKWELSHLMSERSKSGDSGIEMERMVAEAGGSSEKHFDALQGAGAKVKRRNVDRRKRMVA